MGTTTTGRRRRAPDSRTVVRIPEQPLDDRVLDLAGPLLERLGPGPTPRAVRETIALVIAFWNAKAKASQFWGRPRPKQLNDLRRRMTGKKATAEDAEAFELLSARWVDKELAFDPRLIGDWSFGLGGAGEPRLSCHVALPDGVEPHVPPPVEQRVAIGGRFLDEVKIRMTATSLLSFPLTHHKGTIGEDGRVTIETKMPTALALFAEGVLQPMGGGPADVLVHGKEFGAMVLTEVRCKGYGGHNDIAVLVFRRARSGGVPGSPATPASTS